ncbi:MAG: hypothetical protein ACFFDT_03585, partial [Candidatus Hodarchaeota archaeon]
SLSYCTIPYKNHFHCVMRIIKDWTGLISINLYLDRKFNWSNYAYFLSIDFKIILPLGITIEN